MPSLPATLQRFTAVLLLACGWGPIHAAHTPAALAAFEHAEREREALEAMPLARRTRTSYQRILDAYRHISQAQPASPQADAAVDAVASLLAEEGRTFHDASLLQASIAQYESLRRTYPQSRFRQSALLSEAEIAQSDLHDTTAAAQSFHHFLELYPHSPLASEARQQLKALEREQPPAQTASRQPLTMQHHRTVLDAAIASQSSPAPRTPTADELSDLNTQPSIQPVPPSTSVLTSSEPPAPAATINHALVTGIRHWSTPIYTRVAIDLSEEVQYEAARVPDPDRIYFDLHGARLANNLIGRSDPIMSDGFLHRVRAAQYAANSTRIVLDVSHVSEYSAFFLPNPWRLIIDIHGSRPTTAPSPTLNRAAGAPASSIDAATSPTRQPDNTSSGPEVTSEVAAEVATLDQQPRRIRATHRPTSGPIAAQVSGTRRAQQPNELDELATNPPETGPQTPSPLSAAGTLSAPAGARTRRSTPTTLSGSAGSSRSVTTTVPTNLTPDTPTLAAREATPTATGQRSLVRALGLKIGRIVIDAGHGGHDSGTLGPEGLEEKDVVLDVALRLGKLLKQRLGADVIYTRGDDTFIPLETRTAIANKAQADLFISVHANSSSDPSARGVEVYYLNFTTSPEALEVAARENAVSNQSIFQLSDLVKKITLKDKIDESHEFASNVETSLYSGLEAGNNGLKDRGVKKAPFVVLIGANMPSILAEISFLTNPDDARQLREPAYRQRIAESLYTGVAHYAGGLSGVRIAQAGRTGN